jgi:hypothetical protein
LKIKKFISRYWTIPVIIISILAIVFEMMALPVSAAVGSIKEDLQEYTETTRFQVTGTIGAAQDFYAQSSYYLDKIALRLDGVTETTGYVTVGLYNVSGSTWTPNAPISLSLEIPIANIQLTASQYYTFQMTNPVHITQGMVYAIVLQVDAGNTIEWYYGPYLNSLNYPSYEYAYSAWYPFGPSVNFDYDIYGTNTQAPSWQTMPATSVGNTSAILNGVIVNLGSYSSVTAQFSWGTTSMLGNTSQPTTIKTPGIAVSTTITGLLPGTLYHYALMLNYGGNVGNGGDTTFTTSGTVTTTTPTTTSIGTTTTTSIPGYTTYDNYIVTGSGYYWNINADSGNDSISQAFTATQTYTLQRIGMYGYQSQNNTDVGLLSWHIYQQDNGQPPTDYNSNGGLAGSQIYNNIPQGISNANWFYFSLGTPITIISGKTYVITLQMERAYSGDTNPVYILGDNSHNGAPTTGYTSINGITWDQWNAVGFYGAFDYKCQGNLITAGSVGTLPATYANGVYILKGHVNSLGSGDKSAHLYFQYGPDDSYGTIVAGMPSTMAGVNDNIYTTAYDFAYNLPKTLTYPIVHYQAFIVGDTTGTTYSGLDVTINLASSNPTATPSIKWTYDNVTSKSANIHITINSLGSELSFSQVFINYGSNLNLTNAPIEITDDIAQEGPLPVFTLAGLTPNTTYYIQIAAIGSVTGQTYTSNPVNSGYSFTTLKSNGTKGDGSGSSGDNGGQSVVTSNIFAFLVKHGIPPEVLWFVLAILGFLPWLLQPIRQHWYVGVGIDVILLGGFIAMQFLNPWLVGLLSVVAGGIIALIIKVKH